MKLITNDESLNDELQELYIRSSHWGLDIGFEEGELRFLKKMLHVFAMPGLEKDYSVTMEAFGNQFVEQEIVIDTLKTRLAALLKTIGPLIGRKNPKIGLAFLEQLATLENEIKQLADEVKDIKTTLFALVETIIKAHSVKTGDLIEIL
jgi:hypothetical protein